MVAGSVAMRWRAAEPTEHYAVTHHVGNWVVLQRVGQAEPSEHNAVTHHVGNWVMHQKVVGPAAAW